jgi:Zn-dependent protease
VRLGAIHNLSYTKRFIMQQKAFLILWLLIPISAGVLYPYLKANPQYLAWLTIGISIYVLFFSIVVHELCHGLAANFCGDPTAKDAGRLTFNPISHVSLVGSIAVPLVLYFMKAQMIFGWAKPVPFNPIKLRQHPRDQVMLAIAGPLSNFTLAYLCFTLYLIVGVGFHHLFPDASVPIHIDFFSPISFQNVSFEAVWFVLFEILSFGMVINVVLGVFNLIPFPPLDGSWILKALLPTKIMGFFGKLQIYGFILLLIALRFGLLDIFFYPAWIVLGIFYGVAGIVFAY